MNEVLLNILSILGALLVLGVLVTVHELGHFGAGRLLGFSIQEFAVGMGPKILSKERNGTLYSLRALPVGGMCKFYGEDEVPIDAKSFNAQKPWKRFLVVFAGPFMNLLFAYLFSLVTVLAYGNLVPAIESVIDQTRPAAVAGLEAGDILLAVDGDKIDYVTDAATKIAAASGPDIVLSIEREGQKMDILLKDVYDKTEGRNFIGINMITARKQYTFFEAWGESFRYVNSIVREMFSFLGGLFTTGVQQGDVMGPVGTISFLGQAVRTGFEIVLRLAVLLSVNLAIINLLPLPALDGGRLVFVIIEAIRKKPVPAEKEGMVHFVGIILLFGLIILLTFNDIRALVGG